MGRTKDYEGKFLSVMFYRNWIILLFLVSPAYSDVCEHSFLEIKFNQTVTEITVEIADTYAERKKGLMFRDNLKKDSGMLFVYDKPGEVGFWMKNTLIPLDLAFADAKGKVVSIASNTEPLSLDLIYGGKGIQYVLEINGTK